jgi:hypothetical protein
VAVRLQRRRFGRRHGMDRNAPPPLPAPSHTHPQAAGQHQSPASGRDHPAWSNTK